MNPIQEIPADFGHWMAGLADGEGSFDIKRENPRPARNGLRARLGGQCSCRFTIALRADDLPILSEIQRTLGVGRIYVDNREARPSPLAQWIVMSKAENMYLVAFFERFPLRAKKARDFAVWSEAVRVWTAMRQRGRVQLDWTTMWHLQDRLRALRGFAGDPVDSMSLHVADGSEPPQLRLIS